MHPQTQTMIQPAQAATTKVAIRTRRTSNQVTMVLSLGQVHLVIVKPTTIMTDIEAGSKRRTLTRRKWHHLVKNDGGKERICLEGGATEIICHLHHRLHRAKREITPLNIYPLHDGKGLQAHLVTRVG